MISKEEVRLHSHWCMAYMFHAKMAKYQENYISPQDWPFRSHLFNNCFIDMLYIYIYICMYVYIYIKL